MPYTASYVDGGKGVYKEGTGIVTGFEILSSRLPRRTFAASSR
jgi:hypothetical protein